MNGILVALGFEFLLVPDFFTPWWLRTWRIVALAVLLVSSYQAGRDAAQSPVA